MNQAHKSSKFSRIHALLLALPIALFGHAGGCDITGGPGRGPGGGATPQGGGSPKAGSRLQAQELQGEDGSVLGVRFFDSQLGVPCEPDYAEDAQLRCLPRAALAADTLYLDAGCSQATASADPCLPMKYARLQLTGQCGARFYKVTAMPRPNVLYLRIYDGTCTSVPNLNTQTIYKLEEAVPASAFVKITAR